jgi:hypothetical protein
VKYLDEIPTFPADSARLLESRYGIATAEAFYEHAMHEPQGLLTALGLKKTVLDHLIKLVEGHIEPAFVRAAQAPAVVQHPRGALDPLNPPRGH